MPVFDCSIAKGDPTGKPMPKGFPEPAQKEVIRSVITEKLEAIKSGKASDPVKLWAPIDKDHPLAGRIFIMDGQHRFVAACILKAKIDVIYKKFGAAGYNEGWVSTQYVEIKPAKEKIQTQIAKTQSKWPSEQKM